MALVTGGAVRVGETLVRGLYAAGYRVWIHFNRSAAPATALATSLTGPSADDASSVGLVSGDLSDPVARRALASTVMAADGAFGGRLDLLVNSAASFESGAFSGRSV